MLNSNTIASSTIKLILARASKRGYTCPSVIGSIGFNPEELKVHFQGNFTVVTLENRQGHFVGVSKKCPGDTHSDHVGIAVACRRLIENAGLIPIEVM
jgi:hypothetical protein